MIGPRVPRHGQALEPSPWPRPEIPRSFDEAVQFQREVTHVMQRVLSECDARQLEHAIQALHERLPIMHVVREHHDLEVRRRMYDPPPPIFIREEDVDPAMLEWLLRKHP